MNTRFEVRFENPVQLSLIQTVFEHMPISGVIEDATIFSFFTRNSENESYLQEAKEVYVKRYLCLLHTDENAAFDLYKQYKRFAAGKKPFSIAKTIERCGWDLWLMEHAKESEYNSKQFIIRLRHVEDCINNSPDEYRLCSEWYRQFRMRWAWTSPARTKADTGLERPAYHHGIATRCKTAVSMGTL